MKSYIIKPQSGHPYINIQENAAHPVSKTQPTGQRGEVVLDALHNNGKRTPLGFFHSELKEV